MTNPDRSALLWRLDADGWPLERIDADSGVRRPVFSLPGEVRPVSCEWPPAPGEPWPFFDQMQELEAEPEQ